MKKGVFLFWTLFSAVIVFALGVQFAYSQGVAFSTTAPPSGVYHSSNEVVCDNCISSGNIANNAVTGSEIADGTINDGDVNVGAGIFSRKINGANGWHFTTGLMQTTNTWYPAIATDLVSGGGAGVMGMTNWNNAIIELACDPAIVSAGSVVGNDIRLYGGFDFFNIFRTNNLFMSVAPSTVPTAYYARNALGTFNQTLLVRPSAGGNSLEFSRNYQGSSPTYPASMGAPFGGQQIEPQAQAFECVVKVLSLCSGAPGSGATCGP